MMRVVARLHVPARATSEEERAYYALNARVYRWFARFYDLVCMPLVGLRRRVVPIASAGKHDRVLDVATGTGSQALAFAPQVGEVVGVDISEAMLRRARHKNRCANATFMAADATTLPFPAGRFDVACISFALHEMPPSIRERALREMMRVTRPGGRIVIVDYALPRNRMGRWLVFHLVRLYEGERYAEFIRADLPAFLRELGLVPRVDCAALLGVARVLLASR